MLLLNRKVRLVLRPVKYRTGLVLVQRQHSSSCRVRITDKRPDTVLALGRMGTESRKISHLSTLDPRDVHAANKFFLSGISVSQNLILHDPRD